VFGNETHNAKEVKQNKDDHLIDATEYIACANPPYLGDKFENVYVKVQNVSKYGGF
jgi:hypothetical protein